MRTKTLKLLATVFFSFLLLYVLDSCQSGQEKNSIEEEETTQEAPILKPSWKLLNTGKLTAGLRGLCTLDENVVWASGGGGTVIRSINGGESWELCKIPNGNNLGFRDIHAFDSLNAIVVSAGLPGKIFKTVDGGKNWEETYSNKTEGIFFDAMEFWDSQHGIVFSDPIDGKFFIIRTSDGGKTWNEIPIENRPETIKDEAGFAASGTCLAVQGEKNVWIGSGGAKARVFFSPDRGDTWQVVDTKMISGNASSGIFSLAFKDAMTGIAVGGNYQKDSLKNENAALTTDGGKTWHILTDQQPNGYKSCVAYIGNDSDQLIALGTSGSDFSIDGGKTWHFMDTTAYNVVSIAKDGSAGFAAGPKGRIAKLMMNSN